MEKIKMLNKMNLTKRAKAARAKKLISALSALKSANKKAEQTVNGNKQTKGLHMGP